MSGILDAALRRDLLEVLDAGVDRALDDEAFDRLARRVFDYQIRTNPPYAQYCERRGRTPATVGHWTEIPPVPTAAFKAVDFISGDAGDPDAVFLTSGTTRGREARGRHVVVDVEPYRRSALPNFHAHFLPDDARLPFLCLAPRAAEQSESSLAWMIDEVAAAFATRAEWFVHPDSGLDDARLIAALERAAAEREPVALVGTTLAFVHLLDRLAAAGRSFVLAEGSRIMDTGGFKGSGRDVEPGDLLAAYRELLGIPAYARVNEYGMTEMCSQFYFSPLRARHAALRDRDSQPRGMDPQPRGMDPQPRGRDSSLSPGADGRGHSVPPWVRTRAVDPDTLDPLEPGAIGLLQHIDLANVGSVMAIQTEDLGVAGDGRFTLLGRSPGAQPRGCSIAMDMLLQDRARA